jgi:hypothetical protein
VLNIALWVSRDDLRRGAPPCPACNKCPRRLNGNYCGSSCERWDMQRRQQPQRQQSYPPSGVRPHSQPVSGNVAWSTTTNTSLSTGSLEANNQYLTPGHLVRCPNCNTPYSVRGRSRPRSETERGDPVARMTLPPCPTCGYSQRIL